MLHFKMAAKKQIFISRKIVVTKIWKNTFPMEFSMKLAQSRRKWIHLHFWNKIWKKSFCLKMVAKTNFATLRNNANLC